MFSIVRKRVAHFPGLLISKPVWDDIGKVAVANIKLNVAEQRQADGGVLKANAQRTANIKRRKGWTYGGRVMSLIAEKQRFLKKAGESFVFTLGSRSITIRPGPALTEIAKWVQQKGYTGWFGISEKGKASIRAVIQKFIKSEFEKAKSKT